MNQFVDTRRNLKAVLFDLDDTLYDHLHSSRTALASLQAGYPHRFQAIPLEELELAHLEILNRVHVDVLNGSLTQDAAREKRWNLLLARFGIEAAPEEQAPMRSRYAEQYRSSRRATHGAIPLLHALRERGLTIGIVSNNLLEEQLEKLEACGLAKLIDSLTVSEEVGIAKPDPRIFHIALERIASRPEEVVMIGDSWVNDIEPAKALGIRAIWYQPSATTDSREGVPVLSSFSDRTRALEMLTNHGR